MDDKPPASSDGNETLFAREVGEKVARKLKVLKQGPRGVWFGLGMSGLIGWSVAVPTLVGAMAGFWWDRRHLGSHSWTLALLSAGLVLGCVNAWHWIIQEDRAMHGDAEEKDE
jgi:ATP synthase protein I